MSEDYEGVDYDQGTSLEDRDVYVTEGKDRIAELILSSAFPEIPIQKKGYQAFHGPLMSTSNLTRKDVDYVCAKARILMEIDNMTKPHFLVDSNTLLEQENLLIALRLALTRSINATFLKYSFAPSLRQHMESRVPEGVEKKKRGWFF